MKVIVIVRQLPGSEKVVHRVIGEPKHDIDDVHHYLNSAADEDIAYFIKQFPEFKKAQFEKTITELII